MQRRVCLVSPGNLAANPRIVKEADALDEAGYAVTAVVSDYSAALRPFDEEIAARSRWRVVRAPRAASERYVREAARVAARLIGVVGAPIPPSLAARASGGPVATLQRAACDVPADLYIAHYIAALQAAGVAALRHRAMLGFDAEDFHSGEGGDAPAEVSLRANVRAVEAAWLPRCQHLTAASPMIASAYAARYGVPTPATLLNVFPLEMMSAKGVAPRRSGAPLRAYWFSQTIGLDRGIQPFLQAMARTRTRVELDLRGGDPWGNFQSLLAFARELGVADRVRLLPLAAPEEMVRLSADYDVGLSLETEVVENHKICLGNKIFTYLLAGVPVLLSDTPAQSRLAGELGEAAAVVSLSDPVGIASTLDRLAGRLDAAKDRAMRLGHDRYNWNVEKKALLASVEAAFAQQRQN